jgi:hypothetical protein
VNIIREDISDTILIKTTQMHTHMPTPTTHTHKTRERQTDRQGQREREGRGDNLKQIIWLAVPEMPIQEPKNGC